jgi:hypothetical protein
MKKVSRRQFLQNTASILAAGMAAAAFTKDADASAPIDYSAGKVNSMGKTNGVKLPGDENYNNFAMENHSGPSGVPVGEQPSLPARLRVVISTDFPPLDVIPGGVVKGPANKLSDPDDVQSMVRFLLYTNEFDVEGLIASAGTFANIAVKQNILDMLKQYQYVEKNLRTHDSRYPTTDHLRSITWQGLSGSYGRSPAEIIGQGKDSEASEKIISLLDQPDSRPIWFCF